MKRLLSVVAIMLLATSALPVKGHALLRGAFDFITGTGADPFVRGKFSPVLRGGITTGTGTAASPRRERWVAFVTLSSVPGSESTGEIHQVRNQDQSYARGNPDEPLRVDPTGVISYIDPAWSKDGKWLAYVQTDNNVSTSSIYVQQFSTGIGAGAGFTPLGSPILIADGSGGLHHRHPAFKGNNTQIAYDSDQGGSIDLWTVDVSLNDVTNTGTVNEASRTRHQVGLDADPSVLNSKAEFKPAYSPDGTKLAYVTNRFGSFQIQIVTLTADGSGETNVGAEVNPALITHDNPSWSSDGTQLYYDAPANEDPANPQDIWRLTLATGQKCNIFIDLAGDVDPDVSQYTNPTRDGILYNYFTFISQAGGFGVQVWLAEAIQNCSPPLAVQVIPSPTQIDINVEPADNDLITTAITFPASVRASGYVARAVNIGGEAMRFRRSIIASPTLMGLLSPATPDTGDCTGMDAFAQIGDSIDCATWVQPDFFTNVQGWWRVDLDTTTVSGVPVNNHKVTMYWLRRTIIARIVALGLVNKYVPLTWRAYTNVTGRQLLGFGYIKLAKGNFAPGSIVLEQNYPNPFNPATKINFAQDRPGNVEIRVFNVRGELVRTVANQWYPQGLHTVSWDGKTRSGGAAASGVYYIRAKTATGTDVIKAVLAK